MNKSFVALIFMLCAISSVADTKVEVYRVPLGAIHSSGGEISMQDVEKITKSISPIYSTVNNSDNEQVYVYDGIRIMVDRRFSDKQKYNKLLEAVVSFAEQSDEIDPIVVRNTVSRLKAK